MQIQIRNVVIYLTEVSNINGKLQKHPKPQAPNVAFGM